MSGSSIPAIKATKLPAPLQEGQGNNDKFNAMLNSCQNPRAVYNALLAFANAEPGGKLAANVSELDTRKEKSTNA